MYMSIGGGRVVRKRDVVCICDIDNATYGRATRDLLRRAEREGALINAAEDIPRSFIVCEERGKRVIYLTQPSPAALSRRMEEKTL